MKIYKTQNEFLTTIYEIPNQNLSRKLPGDKYEFK